MFSFQDFDLIMGITIIGCLFGAGTALGSRAIELLLLAPKKRRLKAKRKPGYRQ